MNAINRLLSISSPELAELDDYESYQKNFEFFDNLANEFFQLLKIKNGFYAFKSALQVFPHTSNPQILNLSMWNNSKTWKFEYKNIIEQCFFLLWIFLVINFVSTKIKFGHSSLKAENWNT